MSEAKSPVVQQGWLRALIFFLVFMSLYMSGSMLLQRNIGSSSIKDLVSKKLQLANPAYSELILFFIISVATVYLFRRFIDRASFTGIGLEWKGYQRDAMVGFFLGPALLCIGSLILYMNGNLNWNDINFQERDFLTSLVFMFLVAFGEELIFRGYILHNLLQSFNRWFALGISSLAFTLAHASNPGVDIIAIINVFVAGLLLGINYIYTRNLSFAILFHFSWNFFQGPILGYDVSGINLNSLFEMETNGNSLLTGGPFGFEGSIFSGILCIIALILLHVVYERSVVKEA